MITPGRIRGPIGTIVHALAVHALAAGTIRIAAALVVRNAAPVGTLLLSGRTKRSWGRRGSGRGGWRRRHTDRITGTRDARPAIGARQTQGLTGYAVRLIINAVTVTAAVFSTRRADHALLIDARSALRTFATAIRILGTGRTEPSRNTLIPSVADHAARTETVLDIVAEWKGSGVTYHARIVYVIIRSTIHAARYLALGGRSTTLARAILSTLPRGRTLEGLWSGCWGGRWRRHDATLA